MKKKSYGKKNDLALGLWVKLARTFSVFSKKTFEEIRTYGLTTPQFSVLECLGHIGSMTIGDLSEKMLISSGNGTVIVDNLEKEGLVQRIRATTDRRVIKVELTEMGKDLFNNIFSSHADHISKLTRALTTEEQETLSHLLKKLGLSIKEMDQKEKELEENSKKEVVKPYEKYLTKNKAKSGK